MDDAIVKQAAPILTSLVKQATGQSVITPATPGEFYSVATTALKAGYDVLTNTINQMWSETVFSIRPYDQKFASLEKDFNKWGNMTRKISIAASDPINDPSFMWPVIYDATHSDNALGTGESVDMYKISKPDLLQTNFYGRAVYGWRRTFFRDQWDVALANANEFMRLNDLFMTDRANNLATYKENVARGLLANAIASILDEGQQSRVFHVVSEYNTATGSSLTEQTALAPENYAAVVRWFYAQMETIAQRFSERTQMYQTVINNKPVLRHTPPERLKAAFFAPAMIMMKNMALSTTYHDDYLKTVEFTPVTFWQSIETPDSISITPVYTDTTGVQKTGEAKEQAHIFGIMYDEDAMGYSLVNSWSATTPFNVDGGYWNLADHADFKSIFDMTEKMVVFIFD